MVKLCAKKVRGVKTNLRDQRNKVAEAARKRFCRPCKKLLAVDRCTAVA